MVEPITPTGFDTYRSDAGTLLRFYAAPDDTHLDVSLSDGDLLALLQELVTAVAVREEARGPVVDAESLAALTSRVSDLDEVRAELQAVVSAAGRAMVRAQCGHRINRHYVCTLHREHDGEHRNTATGVVS